MFSLIECFNRLGVAVFQVEYRLRDDDGGGNTMACYELHSCIVVFCIDVHDQPELLLN